MHVGSLFVVSLRKPVPFVRLCAAQYEPDTRHLDVKRLESSHATQSSSISLDDDKNVLLPVDNPMRWRMSACHMSLWLVYVDVIVARMMALPQSLNRCSCLFNIQQAVFVVTEAECVFVCVCHHECGVAVFFLARCL